MAIKIVPNIKNETPNSTPYYNLIIDYMIGDADGETCEEVKLSIDNPHIERFVTLLNKLEAPEGYWGVTLQPDRIKLIKKEGQISEDDLDFLLVTMFNEKSEKYNSKEDKFLTEFSEVVVCETEYSFLVFETCYLEYYDEYGESFATIFEDE